MKTCHFKRALISFPILLLLLLTGCASEQLIADREYLPVQNNLERADPQTAVALFPEGEPKGFITSVEKAWLSLWINSANQDEILRQARTLDERKFLSATRETKYLFFGEAEDGYLPAEHEVITLHLISAMIYLRQNNFAEARVEAKAATYYFETLFNPDQPHFDDPALRLWLASIWLALGEWQEAQVDLRRIHQLAPSKEVSRWFANAEPPKEFTIQFYGLGPKIIWTKGETLPAFAPPDPPEGFSAFAATDTTAEYPVQYNSLPWLERHLNRNSLLREEIQKSRYMTQFYGLELQAGLESSVAYSVEGTLKATGIAAGLAVGGTIMYFGFQANSSELIGLGAVAGLGVGEFFWLTGKNFRKSVIADSQKYKNLKQSELHTYRYVRFLPSWVAAKAKSASAMDHKMHTFNVRSPDQKTSVQFVRSY